MFRWRKGSRRSPYRRALETGRRAGTSGAAAALETQNRRELGKVMQIKLHQIFKRQTLLIGASAKSTFSILSPFIGHRTP
jgi:hypothetical protein